MNQKNKTYYIGLCLICTIKFYSNFNMQWLWQSKCITCQSFFKVLYKTQLLIGGIASVYQLVKIKDVFDTCGELLAAKKHPPPAPLICEVN